MDENGEPLKVWHGTHRDFETFDRNYAEKDRVGLKLDTVGNWFTDSQETARTNYGPKQMPEFLNIKKPLVFSGEGAWKQFRRTVEMEGGVESFREKAKAEGYDGVQIAGDKIDRAEQTMWITLDPTQIKSATDNNGEFNPEDPNSLHARASDATGYDAEIDDLIASLTSSGKLDWQDVILEKESARLENPDGDAFAVPSSASPGTMTLRQLFGGVNSLSSYNGIRVIPNDANRALAAAVKSSIPPFIKSVKSSESIHPVSGSSREGGNSNPNRVEDIDPDKASWPGGR